MEIFVDGSPMCIALLIAEPDRQLQTTLAQFFAAEGFYTHPVASPEALLRRLRGSPPTVLLLEPELLQGELLRDVSPIRTIVLTRHTGPPILLPRCLHVVATFAKPAPLGEVSAAIRHAAETALIYGEQPVS